MRTFFKIGNALRSIPQLAAIVIIVLAVIVIIEFISNGQQIESSKSCHAPTIGVKDYYEVYGEGEPLFCSMVLFLPLR